MAANERLTVLAQQRLDEANDMYRRGKDNGTVMSLLLLALYVLDALPRCATVVLEQSDQGNFMTLEGAKFLTVDGQDAAVDDDALTVLVDEADASFAWNLESRDQGWVRYTENRDGRTLDLAAVIDRLRGQV